MNKRIIKLTILLIICFGIATGCSCSKKEKKPDIKVNTEQEVIKDREVDGITTITTSVTNDSNTDYYLKEYTIIIKGENGE